MWDRSAHMLKPVPLLLLLALAACGSGKSDAELAKLNRELARDADPAVTAALEDPVMTDRDLTTADDSRRIRSVRGPAEAIYPPRSKANAPALSALDGLRPAKGCETGFVSGEAWAARLPAPFAVYPGAQLIEAAGNETRPCRSRVASFRVAAPVATVLDWYRTRAVRAGYSAEVQRRGADTVMGGTRPRDGASYYLVVSPRSQASETALITSGG